MLAPRLLVAIPATEAPPEKKTRTLAAADYPAVIKKLTMVVSHANPPRRQPAVVMAALMGPPVRPTHLLCHRHQAVWRAAAQAQAVAVQRTLVLMAVTVTEVLRQRVRRGWTTVTVGLLPALTDPPRLPMVSTAVKA